MARKSKTKIEIELKATGDAKLKQTMKKASKDIEAFNKRSKKSFNGLTQSLQRGRNVFGLYSFAVAAAATALWGLNRAMGSVIEASNLYENSLAGLNSISASFGISTDLAKQAAVDLAEDGLMTVADAAASLKNFLAKGFSLPEAIQLMKQFKDMAAFARQGALSFGQAIVGATEGVKNDNSIKVDNVGLTKNLSVIYKEYATTIGTTAAKLNDVQKRQALVLGVTRESAAFTGDAAKLTKLYSGATAALDASMLKLKATIGDQLKPELKGMKKDTRGAIESFTDFIKETNAVGDTLSAVLIPFKFLGNAFRFIGLSLDQITLNLPSFSAGLGQAPSDSIAVIADSISRLNSVIATMKEQGAGKDAIAAMAAEVARLEGRLITLKGAADSITKAKAAARAGEEVKPLAAATSKVDEAQAIRDALVAIDDSYIENSLKNERLLTEAAAAGREQEMLGARIVAETRIAWEEKASAARLTAISSGLSAISTLANVWATKSKAMFNISKAASAAQATVSAFASYSKTLELYGGTPWGFAAAGASLAAGLAQVASIAATSFGGGGRGGGGAAKLSEREQIIQSFQSSQRRANIKQELINEGILPGAISTSGSIINNNQQQQQTFIFNLGDRSVEADSGSKLERLARDLIPVIDSVREGDFI